MGRRARRKPTGTPKSSPAGEPHAAAESSPASRDTSAPGNQSDAAVTDAAAKESSVGHELASRVQLPTLSRILSVVMLIFGILAVGALFYRVMAGFFVPLFLAALLVVLFRPIHDWIFRQSGGRARVAAAATTSLILSSVLLPILLVLSIAAGQFTAMLSQLNFNDVSNALERARDQLGISLEYPERFQRLNTLADSLDQPNDPARMVSMIKEAKALIRFLHANVASLGSAEEAAEAALGRLDEFMAAVLEEEEIDLNNADAFDIDDHDHFHRQSLSASASIRSWMHAKLGGSLRSQLRLLANPSDQDFATLLSRARESLQPRFVRLTSATGGFLLETSIGLVVLVIAVYFFLIDGPSMIHTLMRLSPLDDNYERRLLLEFDRTSRAVVLASVASALAQGGLSAIAFYFLGFHSVIFLFLVTSLMSLVPFLGAAAVWFPCAIWLGAVEQRWGAAIFLFIYGATLVSSIDNVIKMFVLHGRSTMHPLFALLSVLGGVQVFGPIGILVGPMVVVFLQTLLEILNHELGAHEPAKLEALEHRPQ